MNHVIIIRKDGDKISHGHIGTDGYDVVFCGLRIPEGILVMWDDPRNPYKGRGNVTCTSCLSEFNNGRREGYRDTNTVVPSMEDTPPATEDS